MKYFWIFLSIILALAPLSTYAQNASSDATDFSAWQNSLEEIASNNVQIQAYRSQLQAQQAANGAALRLPDPEAEVAYLFGSPKGIPNRTNVSLTQTLDWSVILGRKRALAEADNQVALQTYRSALQRVLADADRALTSVVYSNRLCSELTLRDSIARDMLKLYAEKFQRGDISQLEYNKVRLNASMSQAELARAESERIQAQLALQALNGGKPLDFSSANYPSSAQSLPPMDSLLQVAQLSSPAVAAAQAAIVQSRAQERVARAEALPQLTVGFQGEYIRQNNYSGLSVGFTLPLWGNARQRVRQAQMQTVANELSLADAQQQLSQAIRQQYAQAQALQRTADELQEELSLTSNDRLLRRSLELGQISLLDYLLEVSFYYSARTAQLEAERDAQLALSQLRGMMY
mgnify:FL=1